MLTFASKVGMFIHVGNEGSSANQEMKYGFLRSVSIKIATSVKTFRLIIPLCEHIRHGLLLQSL